MDQKNFNLKEELKTGKLPFLEFDRIDFEEIKSLGDLIKRDYKNLLVVGTGASVINSRAIISCVSKLDFQIKFLDNLDPYTAKHILSQTNKQDTAILIISKSGDTNEIIELFQYLDQNLVIANNLFVMIESKDSNLAKLTAKYTPTFIAHPSIGGRFSILTKVGLLVSYIAGVDIDKLLKYAKQYLEALLLDQVKICSFPEQILKHIDSGRSNFIIMHYGDQLSGLYEWVRQMYAESLGKNGFGFTTIISKGTIDQHSQLQLYLDGPDDKFYQIDYLDQSSLLVNDADTRLNTVFKCHAESTYLALKECKRPVLKNYIDNIYEFVAKTIIDTMVNIFYIAKIKGLEPFGQPAVEIGKKYVKEALVNNLRK